MLKKDDPVTQACLTWMYLISNDCQRKTSMEKTQLKTCLCKMKCPTEKAAEAVMEFLPLSQFEFQFYTGFLVCNDHNMSWSQQPTSTAAHTWNYCFTTQIFCWKFYLVGKYFEAFISQLTISVMKLCNKTPVAVMHIFLLN